MLDHVFKQEAGLLALLCVMFSCVFVTFPYGVMGNVWYLMYRFLTFAFFLTLKYMNARLYSQLRGLKYMNTRLYSQLRGLKHMNARL